MRASSSLLRSGNGSARPSRLPQLAGQAARSSPLPRLGGEGRERGLALTVAFALSLLAAPATAAEWSGDLTVEATGFVAAPLDPRQTDGAWSVAFEPEWYHDWNDGRDRLQVTVFGRWDSADEARSHLDLRELYWRHSFESAELRVGVRKVFWGVAESQHLVDVINQTDAVENLDGEDKLGQPMVNLALLDAAWAGGGSVELFAMPWFRERTFASAQGRPRLAPRIEPELALWESSDQERHLDLAARWQRSVGAFDVGVAYFAGTARDPLFVATTYPPPCLSCEVVLAPLYLQARQWSLDLQNTQGAWLWKLEWLRRDWQPGRYTAATVGFERTAYGLFGGKDLGLIVEYLFDDRPVALRTTPFDDDLFLGARLAWNDEQSTELLAGAILDLTGDGAFVSVEWRRRLGGSYTLALEARAILDATAGDPLAALRDDDYLRLELGWYF